MAIGRFSQALIGPKGWCAHLRVPGHPFGSRRVAELLPTVNKSCVGAHDGDGQQVLPTGPLLSGDHARGD